MATKKKSWLSKIRKKGKEARNKPVKKKINSLYDGPLAHLKKYSKK